MSYLRYLCLFAYTCSGVQHIFVFLRLVYPMLPVSLDCPFLIAPSVYYNIYLLPVSLQMMHANISSFVFQSSSVNLSDLRYKTTHRSDKFSFSQVIFLAFMKTWIFYFIKQRYKNIEHKPEPQGNILLMSD